jgi:hypothetical protein
MGLGATNLHAASSDVGSITRFAWTLGGGRNTTSVNGWERVSRRNGHPRTSPPPLGASGATRSGADAGSLGTATF